MPTTVPLIRLPTETSSSARVFGIGMLTLWAVSMLLFAAITMLGDTTPYYDALTFVPAY